MGKSNGSLIGIVIGRLEERVMLTKAYLISYGGWDLCHLHLFFILRALKLMLSNTDLCPNPLLYGYF